MRYDTPSLFLIRNPYGDESLVHIVRAAFVCDSSQRAALIARCIEMPELRIDLLSPDADIPLHFKKYRPDVLVISTELLGGDSFAKLLWVLKSEFPTMPLLVTVGREPEARQKSAIEPFRGWLHLGAWADPFTSAESLRRFILDRALDRRSLTNKLRESASLTLRAMHAEGGAGVEYLLDEVTAVLESSYVFFGSALALHKTVAEKRGISPGAVDIAVRPVVEKAIKAMSDSEYLTCFAEYERRRQSPGEPEFVYAAAKLTSLTCTRLIQLLNDCTPPLHGRSGIYE